ncbi:hypothetical protein Tel_08895 [Candidatus Tenderia electrophaga]|jgi:1,4-alpha-glucan branching enzyme|uniref:Glycosyl hydrolase family 13 catalytic domain-containing protein n=1 Tax=Candidatus Tenderia electrophaga TaxID=1748243 RepID=A0A0S2TDP3_9GAMM|nr:hypothetical protein Tel_08895 [Candidatus Tenderia electrophaga]
MPFNIEEDVAPLARQSALSALRIPVENALRVEIRFSLLDARDRFYPREWYKIPLLPSRDSACCHEINLADMGLADGVYEYEFILDGNDERPVADPYAEEITRFGGYRGVFRIKDGLRWQPPFSWQDELSPDYPLPANNQLVIYEMPLRWMHTPPGETGSMRQLGLGTFDRVIFEHLDNLADLGINAIELLPVQDSADTLNWGYGTRFFFCPDIDMGTPVDMKFFIKCCHQRGIRVFLDVVMNHARECPLEPLAESWFFLNSRDEEPGRGEDYGARLFRYRSPGADGRYWAREFHLQMADYWIGHYHIDGFRIDEFRGIDHWEFIQSFTEHAWASHHNLFPHRPFLVIAEDSWRRAVITKPTSTNPNGRKVVDAMWNFAFRDELRRLMRDDIHTEWGQPARRARIQALIGGWRTWNDLESSFKAGFDDLAQAVNYITSHDVENEGEQRYFNAVFARLLRERGLSDGNVEAVRWFVNNLSHQDAAMRQAHEDALQQIRSAFVLLLTAVGIPMILAGEEFGDCHDLDHNDWRLKMSDPIDWHRAYQPGHQSLRGMVRALIELRRRHPALQRNEVDFFYFHPGMDERFGERVFAYCRSAGRPLGNPDQVMVIANCSARNYPEFYLPWHWRHLGSAAEVAAPLSGAAPEIYPHERRARFSLAPFQVRVLVS